MNAANRSPAVYNVMIKNNSKDDEKSLTVLEWKNVQTILNTESTLFVVCYMFLCSSLLFATCLYILK